MATSASKVLELQDWSTVEIMGSVARAANRGFPMIMLCVNEDMVTDHGQQSVPVLTVCNNMDHILVEDWSSHRYAQDPLRRMSATGLLDLSSIRTLLWEIDGARISVPSARVTSLETETLQLAYSRGVRTGVNVPLALGGAPGRVVVSFFSNERIEDLGEIDDSRAILFYLAHTLYDVIAWRVEAESRRDGPRLTPRERECLTWIGRGKTANEIAIILDLAVDTVRDHVKSIRAKLGAATRAEAVARAAAFGGN